MFKITLVVRRNFSSILWSQSFFLRRKSSFKVLFTNSLVWFLNKAIHKLYMKKQKKYNLEFQVLNSTKRYFKRERERETTIIITTNTPQCHRLHPTSPINIPISLHHFTPLADLPPSHHPPLSSPPLLPPSPCIYRLIAP